MELIQIDDSNPAPYLRIVSGPAITKRTPRPSDSDSPRNKKYREFFEKLRNKLLSVQPNFTKAKALSASWWSLGIGRSGFSEIISFTFDNKFRVELYIDLGKKELNVIAFNYLYEKNHTLKVI